MAYPYGLQGFPAVGNSAPGLPQRSPAIGADPAGPPLVRVYMRAVDGPQQVYNTPDWATFARVTAIGKGGRGRGGNAGLPVTSGTAHGGGGAGLAGSSQEAVSAGIPINVNFDSDAVRVGFLGYQLAANNGGDATAAAGGSGGVGTGGAVNFNGGAGATTSPSLAGSGGGAAGRGGNGSPGRNGFATAADGSGDGGAGDAYTTGGGAGGASTNAATAPPFGIQGRVKSEACLIGAAILGQTAFPNRPSVLDGGDGGGGSTGTEVLTYSNIPGAALVLIELW